MIDTHKVYDADALALYFRAYLSDAEYVDDNSDDVVDISVDILSEYERELLEMSKDEVSNANIITKNVGGVNKKFIKGERLKYYPTGMTLYSCSRDLNGTIPEESNIRPMDADIPEILRGFGAKKVIT